MRQCRRPAFTAASALPALASTAAAAVAATATTAAAATAGARLALLGFVDAQRAAVDLLAVHRLDGALGVVVRRHLDEREAPRPAGVPVLHDADARDLAAVALERGGQGGLGR